MKIDVGAVLLGILLAVGLLGSIAFGDPVVGFVMGFAFGVFSDTLLAR